MSKKNKKKIRVPLRKNLDKTPRQRAELAQQIDEDRDLDRFHQDERLSRKGAVTRHRTILAAHETPSGQAPRDVLIRPAAHRLDKDRYRPRRACVFSELRRLGLVENQSIKIERWSGQAITNMETSLDGLRLRSPTLA